MAKQLAWCFAIAATALGCGAPSKTDCNDGFDNDSDGLIDDADPGCGLNGDVEAPDPVFPQCSDGLDNDGDALVDFPEDPGCTSEDDDDEFNPPPEAQCNDGIDNDGDQRTDYPNDPGCASQLEDDETDDCPDGPACPACSNGDDDDGDEMADYPADPGCGSAGDEDEFNTIPGVCGPTLDIIPLGVLGPGGLMATGQHLGGVPNELQSPGCSGLGGETVYAITLTEPASVYVTTDFPETTLDTVVYLRMECRNPDTELGCNDDETGKQKVSELLVTSVPAGSYYVVVDAFGPGSIGDFKVQILPFKSEGDECDPAVMPSECPPGLVCRFELPGSPTTTCVEEECADGNDNDGDGDIDFPNDPGCTGLTDNTETDDCPAGPMCPQCGNGTDDDGDTFIDYPADPGCAAAADGAEIDECIPGVSVSYHPGGTVTGTTVGGTSLLSAPFGCGFNTEFAPERVYVYTNTRVLDQLVFDTVGSAFDTVLYVRPVDCSVPGPAGSCNDNSSGTTSRVALSAPATGQHFAIVDGNFGGSGAFSLTVRGTISPGQPCDVADTFFVCGLGYACHAGVCDEAECNDGVDNDGDTDIDDFDPGCTNSADDSEAPDPSPLPECADGIDNDADGPIDYPADDDCRNAADDKEEQTPFLAAEGKSGTIGNLYEVDPTTGGTTLIGAIGFPITGLAICPDGTVYGAQGGRAASKDLIEIDPDTGAGTTIGPTGMFAIPDLTCLPDGRLLGWTESSDSAIELNKTTGAATVLGPGTGSAGSGMASNAAGTVYFVPFGCSSPLYTVNTTTGAVTAGPSVTGCTYTVINSMTFYDGVLYANDANRTAGMPSQLGTVNTTTGVYTAIGALPANIDAIAGTF